MYKRQVITDEANGVLEIKNIATVPEYQGKGYAKSLIDFLVKEYGGKYSILQVGTGDSPMTIPFYEKCGFVPVSYTHLDVYKRQEQGNRPVFLTEQAAGIC